MRKLAKRFTRVIEMLEQQCAVNNLTEEHKEHIRRYLRDKKIEIFEETALLIPPWSLFHYFEDKLASDHGKKVILCPIGMREVHVFWPEELGFSVSWILVSDQGGLFEIADEEMGLWEHKDGIYADVHRKSPPKYSLTDEEELLPYRNAWDRENGDPNLIRNRIRARLEAEVPLDQEDLRIIEEIWNYRAEVDPKTEQVATEDATAMVGKGKEEQTD